MGIALHSNRREAAPEERSVAAVPVVDPLCEAAAKEPHGLGEPPTLAEEQQMEVVAEQAPAVDLDAIARHGHRQALAEYSAVVVAAEDRLPVGAAVHDVLPRPLVVLAPMSWHGVKPFAYASWWLQLAVHAISGSIERTMRRWQRTQDATEPWGQTRRV
jgi:hypothetical protein